VELCGCRHSGFGIGHVRRDLVEVNAGFVVEVAEQEPFIRSSKMSLGFCCLFCVAFYKLGAYNQQHPGKLWERLVSWWKMWKEQQ
jgi:hypothetical protein